MNKTAASFTTLLIDNQRPQLWDLKDLLGCCPECSTLRARWESVDVCGRYTVEETIELLKLLGFKTIDSIEAHGVSGADLLELDDQELRDELKLPPLQLRKLKNLKAAFKTFNSMQRRPGKGDVTYMELQVIPVLEVLL